jgi:hypothetical protein
MTDTNPRDLIKLLIDVLKEECNWIDNPKHDELIAKATAYLTQYEPETATDEELNSKSSPNNLQIRSSDIVPPPDLIRQWMEKTEYDEDTWFYESYIAEQAAQWGADQELEACCEWIADWYGHGCNEVIGNLRTSRRPKPPSLKGPTDDELLQVFDTVCLSEGGTVDEIHLRGLRAVLARWGK